MTTDERKKICDGCEFLFTKFIKICSVCKCSIEIKTRIESASCPKGKW